MVDAMYTSAMTGSGKTGHPFHSLSWNTLALYAPCQRAGGVQHTHLVKLRDAPKLALAANAPGQDLAALCEGHTVARPRSDLGHVL